jgi:hypothetical protein
VLLFTDPSLSQKRGALILLATTVPMLWSRLLFRFFANFILEIDASLTTSFLRVPLRPILGAGFNPRIGSQLGESWCAQPYIA